MIWHRRAEQNCVSLCCLVQCNTCVTNTRHTHTCSIAPCYVCHVSERRLLTLRLLKVIVDSLLRHKQVAFVNIAFVLVSIHKKSSVLARYDYYGVTFAYMSRSTLRILRNFPYIGLFQPGPPYDMDAIFLYSSFGLLLWTIGTFIYIICITAVLPLVLLWFSINHIRLKGSTWRLRG